MFSKLSNPEFKSRTNPGYLNPDLNNSALEDINPFTQLKDCPQNVRIVTRMSTLYTLLVSLSL